MLDSQGCKLLLELGIEVSRADDDGDVPQPWHLPHASDHFPPGADRHALICQDQVRNDLESTLEPGLAILGDDDAEMFPEKRLVKDGYFRVIIDDQEKGER